MLELNESLFDDNGFEDYLDEYDFDEEEFKEFLKLESIDETLDSICKDLNIDLEQWILDYKEDNYLPSNYILTDEDKEDIFDWIFDEYSSNLLNLYRDDISRYIRSRGKESFEEYEERKSEEARRQRAEDDHYYWSTR